MPTFHSILFPVDFSDRCVRAAAQVRVWSQSLGVPVRVLHASSGDTGAAEQRLQAWVHEQLPGVTVAHAIAGWPPADAILAEATKGRLIMMPTHGEGRFRGMLVGSVTAKVLHDAPCPVWTAAHAATARPLRAGKAPVRIVCGIDTTDAAPGLITFARELAGQFGASLTLVHAMPAVDDDSRNRGEKAVRRYWVERALKELAPLLKKARAAEPVMRGGPIADVLAEVAREQTAGLMIIGRGHANKKLGRLRTHSLSIVAKSPCPVISV
jgi:nucleotide-binding universal stress UspA family protein